MKTKQSSETGRADLERKEWCFRSIPQSEMDACYIYEYLRELARRPQGIVKTPDRNGSVQAVGEFRKLMTGWIRWDSATLKDCDPNISWQELNQKSRSALVRILTGMRQIPSLTIEPARELDVTNIKEFRRLHESYEKNEFHLERTEYGFFAINWRFDDREIKRQFAQWLSEQRKEIEARGWTEIDYKTKARGGSMDRLNWLGARRVVKHYRKKQLVDYADTNLKVDAPYSHLPDLYKNAKKAGNLLKVFSETLR